MKQVTMNHTVFRNSGRAAFIVPTISWLAHYSDEDFELEDIEVTFQLDYSRGEYRIQIIENTTHRVLVDEVVKLPCAETGEQKNIDDIMGLLKPAIERDRRLQVQTAANQFNQWFDRKVQKWLLHESEKVRYNTSISDWDFCALVTKGHETL